MQQVAGDDHRFAHLAAQPHNLLLRHGKGRAQGQAGAGRRLSQQSIAGRQAGRHAVGASSGLLNSAMASCCCPDSSHTHRPRQGTHSKAPTSARPHQGTHTDQTGAPGWRARSQRAAAPPGRRAPPSPHLQRQQSPPGWGSRRSSQSAAEEEAEDAVVMNSISSGLLR